MARRRLLSEGEERQMEENTIPPLERAAQARIRSMESELKQPRAGWWPFRAR